MYTNNDQETGPVECRICHSKTTRDLILSPCLCKGSMGCVHIRCLEQWLNISSHNFCELCSYRFEVIQVRRYSLLKSLKIWIFQDQGSLYKAIFFIVLSATNSVLLSWMWFLWLTNVPTTLTNGKEPRFGDKEIPNQESQDVSRPKWMAVFVFLTILTLFSIKSLCFDGYKAAKAQYHAWYQWWNETVNVQLVLDLENYKIKNRLEESKDFALKYNREKTGLSNQNVKHTDLTDEDSNKLIQNIPEVHNVGKTSSANLVEIFKPIADSELDESDKFQELVKNLQEDTNEFLTSDATIINISEDTRPNLSLEDIPNVHQKYTSRQD